MHRKRSPRSNSTIQEEGIFIFLTLVIFFVAIGFPTIINTSPTIGYDQLTIQKLTPVTTFYQEAYAEQETFNILTNYYFNPIPYTAFLLMPTTLDNLPPEDPLQYFERRYSQGIQLEFGFIEFNSIQEFLTPNIDKSDYLPPIINEFLDFEILPPAYALLFSQNETDVAVVVDSVTVKIVSESVCDSEIGLAFRVGCYTFDSADISNDTSTNLGTLGSNADALYFENDAPSPFNINVTGKIKQAVIQEGVASVPDDQGEIRFGLNSSRAQWDFLHRFNVGSNLTSINFWILGDVAGAPEYPIFNNMNPRSPEFDDNGWMLWAQGTQMCQVLRQDGFSVMSQTCTTTTGVPADDGQYHMVTVLMDKGNTTANLSRICIDGSSNCQSVFGSAFQASDSTAQKPLKYGSNHFVSSLTENTFHIDDLGIWSGYQLTDEDIDTLFALSATPFTALNTADTVGVTDETSTTFIPANQLFVNIADTTTVSDQVNTIKTSLPSSDNLYLYYKFNDLPVTNEIFTKLGASLLGNTTATGSPTLGTGLFGEANGAHSYSSTSVFEETDLGIAGTILKDRMVLPFEETPKISNGTTLNFWGKGTSASTFDTILDTRQLSGSPNDGGCLYAFIPDLDKECLGLNHSTNAPVFDTDNAYHMYTFVYNETSGCFPDLCTFAYVDAILIRTDDDDFGANPSLFHTDNTIRIGMTKDTSPFAGQEFSNLLDELSYWNTPLSQAQIDLLFNNGVGFNITLTPAIQSVFDVTITDTVTVQDQGAIDKSVPIYATIDASKNTSNPTTGLNKNSFYFGMTTPAILGTVKVSGLSLFLEEAQLLTSGNLTAVILSNNTITDSPNNFENIIVEGVGSTIDITGISIQRILNFTFDPPVLVNDTDTHIFYGFNFTDGDGINNWSVGTGTELTVGACAVINHTVGDTWKTCTTLPSPFEYFQMEVQSELDEPIPNFELSGGISPENLIIYHTFDASQTVLLSAQDLQANAGTYGHRSSVVGLQRGEFVPTILSSGILGESLEILATSDKEGHVTSMKNFVDDFAFTADNTTESYGFSLWINGSSWSTLTSNAPILSSIGQEEYGIALTISPTQKVQYQIANNDGVIINQVGSVSITDNNWQHIGISINKADLGNVTTAIYVNGTLDLFAINGVLSSGILDAGLPEIPLAFGENVASSFFWTTIFSEVVDFNVDDFCMWRGYLPTGSDMATLFNSGVGATCSTAVASSGVNVTKTSAGQIFDQIVADTTTVSDQTNLSITKLATDTTTVPDQVTATKIAIPNPVTGLTAVFNETSQSIDLSWTGDANSYRIFRTSTESVDTINFLNTGLTSTAGLVLSQSPRDHISQNNFIGNGLTGKIITDAQFRCKNSNTATGGFLQGAIFVASQTGQTTDDTLANSTNSFTPESISSVDQNCPVLKFRDDGLINHTTTGLRGIGLSWINPTSGTFAGSMADTLTGGSEQSRWDGSNWARTNGFDLRLAINQLNQTKLSADPQVSDTGSSAITFSDTIIDETPINVGNTYFYRVVGLNTLLVQGALSNIANATAVNATVPQAVTSLNATFNETTQAVDLEWNLPIDADGFRILRTSTETADEVLIFDTTITGTFTSSLTEGGDNFDGIAEHFDFDSSTNIFKDEMLSKLRTQISRTGTLDGTVLAGIWQDSNGGSIIATLANSTTTFAGSALNLTLSTVDFDFIGSDLLNKTTGFPVFQYGSGIYLTGSSTGTVNVLTNNNLDTGGLKGGLGEWNSVTNNWDGNAIEDIRGEWYIINRTKLESGHTDDALVLNTGSTVTTFIDSTVINNETYFYRVIPINLITLGGASPVANATTVSIAPDPITDLQATNINSVFLNWTAPAGTITGYKIQRNLGNQSIFAGDGQDLIRGSHLVVLNVVANTFDRGAVAQRFTPTTDIEITGIQLRVICGFNCFIDDNQYFGGIWNDTGSVWLANSTNFYTPTQLIALQTLSWDFDPSVPIASGQDITVGIWGENATSDGDIRTFKFDFGDKLLGSLYTSTDTLPPTFIATGDELGIDIAINSFETIVADTGTTATNFTDATCPEGMTCFYNAIALNGVVESLDSNLANATEGFVTGSILFNKTGSEWQYREFDDFNRLSPKMGFDTVGGGALKIEMDIGDACCFGGSVTQPASRGMIFKVFNKTDVIDSSIIINMKGESAQSPNGFQGFTIKVLDGGYLHNDYFQIAQQNHPLPSLTQQQGFLSKGAGTLGSFTLEDTFTDQDQTLSDTNIAWANSTEGVVTVAIEFRDSSDVVAFVWTINNITVTKVGTWNFTAGTTIVPVVGSAGGAGALEENTDSGFYNNTLGFFVPLPPTTAPANFILTLDNINEEIDLTWNAVPLATDYVVQRLSTERTITTVDNIQGDNNFGSGSSFNRPTGDSAGLAEGDIGVEVTLKSGRFSSSTRNEMIGGIWYNVTIGDPNGNRKPDSTSEVEFAGFMASAGTRLSRDCNGTFGFTSLVEQDGYTQRSDGTWFDGACVIEHRFLGNQLINGTGQNTEIGAMWLNGSSSIVLIKEAIGSGFTFGTTGDSPTGTWNTLSGNNIELRVLKLNQTFVNVTTTTNTFFTDTTTNNYNSYFYRIIPKNIGGEGLDSIIVNGTLSVRPQRVPDLNGTDNGATVDLVWAEAPIKFSRALSEDPVQGYIIQRALSNETTIYDGLAFDTEEFFWKSVDSIVTLATGQGSGTGGSPSFGSNIANGGQILNITQATNITRMVVKIGVNDGQSFNTEPDLAGGIWFGNGTAITRSIMPRVANFADMFTWSSDKLDHEGFVNWAFSPPVSLVAGEYIFGWSSLNAQTCVSASCGLGNADVGDYEVFFEFTNNGDADGYGVVGNGGQFPPTASSQPINNTKTTDYAMAIFAEPVWTTIGTNIGVSNTSFTDTSPPIGVTKAYRVLAFNDAGLSHPPTLLHNPQGVFLRQMTNTTDFFLVDVNGEVMGLNVGEVLTFEFVSPVPDQVTGLNITQNMNNNATLDWNDALNADNYQVLRKINFSSGAEVNTNGTWQFREFQNNNNPLVEGNCAINNFGTGSTGSINLFSGDGGGKSSTCDLWKHFPRDFLNNTRIQFKYDFAHISTSSGLSPQTIVSTRNEPNVPDRTDDSDWASSGKGRNWNSGSDVVSLIDSQNLILNGGVIQDDMIDFQADWNELDTDYVSVIFRLSDSNTSGQNPSFKIFWVNITDFTTGAPKAFYNFSEGAETNERTAGNCDGIAPNSDCAFGVYNVGSFTVTNELFEEIGTPITSEFEDSTLPLQGVSTYKVRGNNTDGFGLNSTEVDFGLIQQIDGVRENDVFGGFSGSLNATALNSTAIKLTWDQASTEHPTDPLTGVIIQRSLVEDLKLDFTFDTFPTGTNVGSASELTNSEQCGVGTCNYVIPTISLGTTQLGHEFSGIVDNSTRWGIAGSAGSAHNATNVSDWDFLNTQDWSIGWWMLRDTPSGFSTFLTTINDATDGSGTVGVGNFDDRDGLTIVFDDDNQQVQVFTMDGNFTNGLNETSSTLFLEEDNAFHHYFITHDRGNEVKWYKDGVLIQTDSSILTSTGKADIGLFVGNCWFGGGCIKNDETLFVGGTIEFPTRVDQLLIFNRVVGSSEISSIFNSGSGTTIGFITIATVDDLDTMFTDNGLAENTTFTYRLKGQSAVSTGSFGVNITATTLLAPTPPDQVTGLVITQEMNNNATLNWNDALGADNYQVLRKTNFTSGVEVNTNGTWQFREFKLAGLVTGRCSINNVGTGATGGVELSANDGGAVLSVCDFWKHFPRDFINNTRLQFKYDFTHISSSSGISAETFVSTRNEPNVPDRSDDSDWSATGDDRQWLQFASDVPDKIDQQGLTLAGGVIQDDLVDNQGDWNKQDTDYVSVVFRVTDGSILTQQPKLKIFWLNITDFDTGQQKAFYNFSQGAETIERNFGGCDGVAPNSECAFGVYNVGSFTVTNEIFEQIGTPITSDFEDSTLPLTGVSTYKVRGNNTNGFGLNSTEVDFGLIQQIDGLISIGGGLFSGSLNATALNSTAIKLTWDQATTEHPSDPLTGVIIQRSNVTVPTPFVTIATVDDLDVMFTDIGLETNTTYAYQLKGQSAVSTGAFGDNNTATTSTGQLNQTETDIVTILDDQNFNITKIDSDLAIPTDAVILISPPFPITTLVGSTVGNTCDLSWSAPPNGGSVITKFQIFRSVDGSAYSLLLNKTITSHIDTGLVNNILYEYNVTSINAFGDSEPSNIVDCMPIVNDVPSTPSPLIAFEEPSGDVTLTWVEPLNGDPTGYQIQRKIENGGFLILVNDTATPALTFLDTATDPSVEYTWRVAGWNSLGLGAFTIPVTLRMDSPASAPILSGAQNGDQIDLSWTVPASDNPITGYKIDRRINFGALSVLVANTTTTLTTFTDLNVTKPDVFGYRVRALSSSGEGTVSNVVDIVFGSHLIVQVREQDGSFFSGGGIVKGENSTFSLLVGLDVNSDATFDNLAVGNFNFTFFDDDNFILNKTFNFPAPAGNLTSTFTINALVFDVDCPDNGVGSDIRIKVNYTDAKDITEFPSTPVCDSTDQVSWSTRWQGDAVNDTSTMIADFISTVFKANAEQFLASADIIPTVFNSGENQIESETYVVNMTDVTINFNLFLGRAPAGGGAPSPSPSSPSQPTPSIPDPEVLFAQRLTGLSILSRTHQFAQAGDVIEGTITVNWEGEINLDVRSIDTSKSNLDIRFDLTPFPLDQRIDGIGEFAMSTADIRYTIVLPADECNPEIGLTQNCFDPILHTIPLEFEFQRDEQVYEASTEVFVDGRPIPLDIVQLQIILLFFVLIASAVFGRFIRNRARGSTRRTKTKKKKFKKKFDSS